MMVTLYCKRKALAEFYEKFFKLCIEICDHFGSDDPSTSRYGCPTNSKLIKEILTYFVIVIIFLSEFWYNIVHDQQSKSY